MYNTCHEDSGLPVVSLSIAHLAEVVAEAIVARIKGATLPPVLLTGSGAKNAFSRVAQGNSDDARANHSNHITT